MTYIVKILYNILYEIALVLIQGKKGKNISVTNQTHFYLSNSTVQVLKVCVSMCALSLY